MRWIFVFQRMIEWFLTEWRTWFSNHVRYVRRKAHAEVRPKHGFRPYQRKPDWVIKEVIRLKVHLPKASCRTVAHTFNRIHQNKRGMTVSKSYVYQQLIKHEHEVLVLRQKIKQRPPHSYDKNQCWQWDITQVNSKPVLGVIDCGTRACLGLHVLANKRSVTLLRCLLTLITRYGLPNSIRSDNKACFNSRLMQVSLWLLGINKQTTQPASPWQNGRVERFFGTLKHHLKQCVIAQTHEQKALNTFVFWYHYVRPHQALCGATPADIWCGQSPSKQGRAIYFSAWDGLLDGFYVPPD